MARKNNAQLWLGPNEFLARAKKAKWVALFKEKHPDAAVIEQDWTNGEKQGNIEEGMAAALQSLSGGGFFNDKVLVIVGVNAAGFKAAGAPYWKRFAEALVAVPATTTAVLWSGDVVDLEEWPAPLREAAKECTVELLQSPTRADALSFLKAEAARADAKISAKDLETAAGALAAAPAGDDAAWWWARTAIAAAPGGTVSISELLMPAAEEKFFPFLDLIGAAATNPSSVPLMKKAAARYVPDVDALEEFLPLFDWQCRLWLTAAAALAENEPNYRPDKVSDYVWKKALQAARAKPLATWHSLGQEAATLQLASRKYPDTLFARWNTFLTSF